MPMLEDRTAVITGAGRGIGRAIAHLFVTEGARVVVNDVDAGPAAEVVAECETLAGAGVATSSIGSVADPAYTDRLMATAADTYGALDVLVNNAGITRDSVIHRMSDEAWSLVIDVNLRGTFNCIRSSTPYMRDVAKREIEQAGEVHHARKIVNFFSTAAIRGNPGQANYTAAKMGNVGLTRTIAQEWARFRICVNAVAPGFTDTRLTKPRQEKGGLGVPEAHRDAIVARTPFGRATRPEEVANAVLFFASPLSDFVTGQELNVSGGLQIP